MRKIIIVFVICLGSLISHKKVLFFLKETMGNEGKNENVLSTLLLFSKEKIVLKILIMETAFDLNCFSLLQSASAAAASQPAPS